jgi:hypothetical protein
VVRDLLLSIDEPQVMSHGRYETLPDMIPTSEGVKTSKFNETGVTRPREL